MTGGRVRVLAQLQDMDRDWEGEDQSQNPFWPPSTPHANLISSQRCLYPQGNFCKPPDKINWLNPPWTMPPGSPPPPYQPLPDDPLLPYSLTRFRPKQPLGVFWRILRGLLHCRVHHSHNLWIRHMISLSPPLRPFPFAHSQLPFPSPLWLTHFQKLKNEWNCEVAGYKKK